MRESNAALVETVGKLSKTIEELNEKLDAALRRLHGKKSERRPKVPPPVTPPTPSIEEIAAARSSSKEQLRMHAEDLGEFEHEVPEEDQRCARCGEDADFRPVGAGRASDLFDYVPGYFRRSRHIIHTVACHCGETILTAAGPERATSRSKYGPGVAALCITHKCLLGTPIHRLEKMLRGHGTPVSRSTLNDLLIRVSKKLEPIHEELIRSVREAEVVHADETPLRLLSHDKQAWVWVFIGGGSVAFVFDRSRSGAVPERVLGASGGALLTDGFAGYNRATAEGRRVAARCHSHIRRKFFEALPTAAHAEEALKLYGEIYRIEAEVKAAGLTRSEAHLLRRREEMKPLFDRLERWMLETRKRTPPKSPLGRAIAYALGQWEGALRCLDDAAIPLDNNVSERALRVVAIGRKNFGGAGSIAGGEMLACLYSLAASCEAAGVDPFAYFRDVITRVGTEEPQDLVPARWAPRG